MSYRYLENWTFADIAFEATGQTLDELFKSALDAMMNVMVSDLNSIELKEVRQEYFVAKTEDELLHEFLQKVLYYKDADQLLLRLNHLSIVRTGDEFHLNANLRGEKLDPRKHELMVDVKAVTQHRFEVKRDSNQWIANVVVDV